MKAIYISSSGYPDLEYINRELKDCKQIIEKLGTEQGWILIVDNVTRADKLKYINEISK